MSPVVLLIGSFMFITNAMHLLGRVDPRSTGVANAVAGVLAVVAGFSVGFSAQGSSVPVFLSSLALVFAGFYLILAVCLLAGFDLSALGWWCLAAALWLGFSVHFFGWGPGQDGLIAIFAVTWTVTFLAAAASLIVGHRPSTLVVPWLLLVQSVITLMLPAYLMITGSWENVTFTF